MAGSVFRPGFADESSRLSMCVCVCEQRRGSGICLQNCISSSSSIIIINSIINALFSALRSLKLFACDVKAHSRTKLLQLIHLRFFRDKVAEILT